MIDLHFWPTPNGFKVAILLEELSQAYRFVPVDLRKGEQFSRAFLEISPNNRIPAIVDHAPSDGGLPLAVFESGAILHYLARKHGRFLPAEARAESAVLQWVMWQVGGLGPMSGQANHFRNVADEKIPYAIERYTSETARLLTVLDRQLGKRDFVAHEYSIADMACYPWIVIWKRLGQDLRAHSNLDRWFQEMRARPAVARAYERGAAVKPPTSEGASDRIASHPGMDASNGR